MRRRRLLSALSTTAVFSGCGGRFPFTDSNGPTDRPSTSTRTPTPTDNAQWLSVKNTRPTTEYVTVAVDAVDGSASFARSVELVSGEETRFRAVVTPGTRSEVVVETADGDRRTYTWTPTVMLDGLATYLTTAGIECWRHVRCRPDCTLAADVEAADLPLIGDGTGRWYAPAGLVVRNPATTTRTLGVSVVLRGQMLLETRYRLPAETQMVVPMTYRSGEYDVRVSHDRRQIENTWPVPQVPERHVVLGDEVRFGCGPANAMLTVSNRDVVTHRLTVRIRRDGQEVLTRTVDLDAKTSESLATLNESGPYEVEAETGDGATATGTWWACPPRGPATLLVDATGSVTLQQGGPQSG